MRSCCAFLPVIVVASIGAVLFAPPRGAAGQGSPASIQIDRDDIGGVVTGAKGPEAPRAAEPGRPPGA